MTIRDRPTHRRAFHNSRARRSRTRRGAAAVELALCLPMLTVFVLGVADFGRAVDARIVVSNAARAGADYAATHRYTAATYATWTGRVRDAVVQETVAAGVASQDVVVSIAATQVSADVKSIQVTARMPFRLLFAWPGLSEQMTLEQSVTMTQFR